MEMNISCVESQPAREKKKIFMIYDFYCLVTITITSPALPNRKLVLYHYYFYSLTSVIDMLIVFHNYFDSLSVIERLMEFII